MSGTFINRADLIEAVRRTLRSLITGTAPYTHVLSDLEGAPEEMRRVQIGRFSAPPIALAPLYPFVAVGDGGVRVEPGPSLRAYESTGLILVTGWTLGGPTAELRLAAAASLEVDLRRAILSNPQLFTAEVPAGLVDRLTVESETVDGRDYQEAGQHHDGEQMGVVEMTVSLVWRDKPGARVAPEVIL